MKTLLTAAEIQQRVAELGREISAVYTGQPLTVVAVLTGSVILVADLMRTLSVPHQVVFVRASSYRGSATTG
ncbi:MAG: hypoxanthine phosphoribosyltransferase, partial [Planctomyces sp.]|nr:hypoxanthine phosphoribosyltransferase [Planctomyces sp.]